MNTTYSVMAAVLVLTALLTPASAAIWEGTADNNWFNKNNWNPVDIPGANATVIVPVGSAILLTNETAELASVTMAGGTLTFSNWTTRLRATEVTINGGTLTLPPAFTEAQMSNRVWIVCEAFTLAENASIEANARGYATGNGEGSSTNSYAGGGHGGFGSSGNMRTTGTWESRGYPYGDEAAPIDPGSGGGLGSASGNGGGAVWIDASGTVTVSGTISANGSNGTSVDGGGGSGGAIFIACETFQGNGNGLLSVQGGDNGDAIHGHGGPAAGGRIAIVYQPTAQAWVTGPNPPVKVNARQGTRRYHPYMAECGTVYLPDGQFLTTNMSATHWQSVTLVIPAMTDWHVNELTVGGVFGIRDLETLRVDGGLTLIAGGSLILHAEKTNSLFVGSATALTVGGALTIASGATLDLVSNLTNGISPYVECETLNLENGGTILADYRGYGPGLGVGAGTTRSGAGHGGAGGRGSLGVAGGVYGKRHAPVFAGSGGGYVILGGRGGGLARISSRHLMLVDGTISAKGMTAPGLYGGGGSGGGILLSAGSFRGSGNLNANAGSFINANAGSGGGGRIAVWTPFQAYDEVQRLANSATLPATAKEFSPTFWPDWSGTHSVDPGTYNALTPLPEPGTVFFGKFVVGTLIQLR